MIIQFHSDRLSMILDKVRRQHPILREEAVGNLKSTIETVRTLLNKTDTVQLQKVAFEFSSSMLLACIDIVAIDKEGETATKATIVATLRPRESMLPRGWLKIVSTYPTPLLEQLVRDIIKIKGYNSLKGNEGISNHLPLWFLTSSLTKGILRHYQSESQKYTLDQYLMENCLTPDDALFKALWYTLLTSGNSNDLKQQSSERIMEELQNRQRILHRMEICQHYLNTLNGLADWSENVLEYILHKFGKPNSALDGKEAEQRFWHQIKANAKDEFRKWMIAKEVKSFFDGERANFWQFYIKSAKIKDVNKILAGRGFMMDFGHFGVVEFKDAGNAAYIYPKEFFHKLWNGAKFWTNSPSHYKEGSQTIKSKYLPDWDGRILHFKGWKRKTKKRIDRIIAEK